MPGSYIISHLTNQKTCYCDHGSSDRRGSGRKVLWGDSAHSVISQSCFGHSEGMVRVSGTRSLAHIYDYQRGRSLECFALQFHSIIVPKECLKISIAFDIARSALNGHLKSL